MGLFKHLDDDLFACQVCGPSDQCLSATDDEGTKGLLRYTSATGFTALRRHVEDHHKLGHDNLKKTIAERSLV